MADNDNQKIILETTHPVAYDRQDSGYTLQCAVTDSTDPDEPFYVYLMSHEMYDTRKKPQHNTARSLAGKKVRVTVEIIS